MSSAAGRWCSPAQGSELTHEGLLPNTARLRFRIGVENEIHRLDRPGLRWPGLSGRTRTVAPPAKHFPQRSPFRLLHTELGVLSE